MPVDMSVFDWSLRLIVAAVLGGLVGLERQTRHKAAGLRTHMLVGLGSALFTLVGAHGFASGDATRVAAQVVTGIGFLGAGAIFKDRTNVSGLTTAAGLWAVAAIGVVAGSGLVLGAVIATAIALGVLYGLGAVERVRRRKRAAGLTRPFGVKLTNLDELTKVVKLTCKLDEGARQISVDRTDDDDFLLSFQLQQSRIPTVTAAVQSFETVIDASEMDPV